MNPGGKGANQAVTVARLGGRVSFICKTGSDIFGHQANQLFNEEGSTPRMYFPTRKNPSGVALITVDTDAENFASSSLPAPTRISPPNDLKRSAEAVEAADIIPVATRNPDANRGGRRHDGATGWAEGRPEPGPGLRSSPPDCSEALYRSPRMKPAEAISGIRITDTHGRRSRP